VSFVDMSKKEQIAHLRANLQTEVDTGYLYATLAESETQPEIAAVYRNLQASEDSHAELWKGQLKEVGVDLPALRPSVRSRILGWIGKKFGAEMVLPTLLESEQQMGFASLQAKQDHGTAASGGEDTHSRLLKAIQDGHGSKLDGSGLARLEGRHRAAGGNALRAAVLGANDGLVSNMSLVMGVAGATMSNTGILITGFAGLLAGSISMALGEWLSVQSSRELYARQIAIETEELELSPEAEEAELSLIYQAKGLPKEQAQAFARKLMAQPPVAIDTLAREELGIDPHELGGSAWTAAITSFLLFAIGAIVPVVPFLLLTGTLAIIVGFVVSALGLFVIGASITLFTGRSIVYSGLRQMLFGLTAAGITYGIGRILGVAIAG